MSPSFQNPSSQNLSAATSACRQDGVKALVPFFTAGYPDEATFLELVAAAGRAGCPVIEIGVPFSDPIADGPVIQASSQAALARGMSLRRALDLTAEAAASTPAALVLMGYLNPILRLGLDAFADAARQAGISGVIVPDVPLEESAPIRRALATAELTLVDLVAPNSDPDRIARIGAVAGGFLYLVSLTGVTGSRAVFGHDLDDFVGRVRRGSDLPLYVGFGVSDREQAERVTRRADGVIIGSALIRIIQSAPDPGAAVARVERFLGEIARALNGSGQT